MRTPSESLVAALCVGDESAADSWQSNAAAEMKVMRAR
jgi:hypothetical protein